MPQHEPSRETTPKLDPSQPTFRSGAVARIAGMPVSTLRIWEQRYQAVGPTTAPSGHRLYTAADVERVALLRRLTEHGHAIGSLAGLDIKQLGEVMRTQASADGRRDELSPGSTPLQIVLVGQAMARRLERRTVLNHLGGTPQVVVFGSLAEAAKAAAGWTGAAIDLVLWQASDLQVGTVPELQTVRDAWRASRVAVTYRFSGAAARDALANAGMTVVREPVDDHALGTWLSSLGTALVEGAVDPGKTRSTTGNDPWSFDVLRAGAAPARRFDDITLTEFGGLSSSIACECPSHVAELLMQISSFESYSASCSSRSPADADLHVYLQRVAGAARVLFESAVERVAIAEGYPLP